MNESGFTLVELMIVIVIVGILAAVAVPIYQGNIAKAKMTECDAALGTIRTAERVYYAENSTYTSSLSDLGLSNNDLTGKYFEFADYQITNVTDSTYTIECIDTDHLGSIRQLTHEGVFSGGE
ncbi:MAG: prepilin-type N-terminal cleavage/methylation domain-containing protein [Candidatus Marinimicrobia bacterium]|nr:prepilin-type N-terminal cleavage/methylation domain-containing protein [Candidatus Neomarinimicrobiota bacterium]